MCTHTQRHLCVHVMHPDPDVLISPSESCFSWWLLTDTWPSTRAACPACDSSQGWATDTSQAQSQNLSALWLPCIGCRINKQEVLILCLVALVVFLQQGLLCLFTHSSTRLLWECLRQRFWNPRQSVKRYEFCLISPRHKISVYTRI